MKKYASMSIQFSRGCPFNCEFCNVTALFGHRPRMKTPQQIIAELDGIYDAGWRGSIFFVDDNFIGNKQYLKTQLLPALIEWRKDKKGCVFFTEASINLADDPELLDLMVTAGFDSVFIGIESPDEACLTECHKTQNKNRDLLENVKIIHRAGIQVMGGFIVGFDSDTPSIFQRQIDFIQKSGIVTAMVGMLQARPERASLTASIGKPRDERVFRRQCRRDDQYHPPNGVGHTFGRVSIAYETDLFAQKLLPAGQEFSERAQGARHHHTNGFSGFLAFFHSGFRLGILGRERFHYWHLLLWTLFRKPKLVPLAVTLAIYGHHFRRICDLYIP
jgi:hypothetical protein